MNDIDTEFSLDTVNKSITKFKKSYFLVNKELKNPTYIILGKKQYEALKLCCFTGEGLKDFQEGVKNMKLKFFGEVEMDIYVFEEDCCECGG